MTKITELPAGGTADGSEIGIWEQHSSTVTMTETTLSALASDNSFNDSADGFVTAGFAEGDTVVVSGFTESANNLTTGVITALTAGKMTIGGTDGDGITDEVAGDSVTISKWVTVRLTAQEVASLSGGGATTILKRYTDTLTISAAASGTWDIPAGAVLVRGQGHLAASSSSTVTVTMGAQTFERLVSQSDAESYAASTANAGFAAHNGSDNVSVQFDIRSPRASGSPTVVSTRCMSAGGGQTVLADAEATSAADNSSVTVGTGAGTLTGTIEIEYWVEEEVTVVGALVPDVIDDATTARTLALTDGNDVVVMSNGSANTVTIPAEASVDFPIGTIITIIQLGAGTTTVTGDTGVTVNGTSAGSADLTAQHSAVSLIKIASDGWNLAGDHGGVS